MELNKFNNHRDFLNHVKVFFTLPSLISPIKELRRPIVAKRKLPQGSTPGSISFGFAAISELTHAGAIKQSLMSDSSNISADLPVINNARKWHFTSQFKPSNAVLKRPFSEIQSVNENASKKAAILPVKNKPVVKNVPRISVPNCTNWSRPSSLSTKPVSAVPRFDSKPANENMFDFTKRSIGQARGSATKNTSLSDQSVETSNESVTSSNGNISVSSTSTSSTKSARSALTSSSSITTPSTSIAKIAPTSSSSMPKLTPIGSSRVEKSATTFLTPSSFVDKTIVPTSIQHKKSRPRLEPVDNSFDLSKLMSSQNFKWTQSNDGVLPDTPPPTPHVKTATEVPARRFYEQSELEDKNERELLDFMTMFDKQFYAEFEASKSYGGNELNFVFPMTFENNDLPCFMDSETKDKFESNSIAVSDQVSIDVENTLSKMVIPKEQQVTEINLVSLAASTNPIVPQKSSSVSKTTTHQSQSVIKSDIVKDNEKEPDTKVGSVTPIQTNAISNKRKWEDNIESEKGSKHVRKSESKHASKTESEQTIKPDSKQTIKSNSKHDSKSDSKNHNKSESEHARKGESKHDSKSESKHVRKNDSKNASKSESKNACISKSKTAPKSESKHVRKIESKHVIKSESKHDRRMKSLSRKKSRRTKKISDLMIRLFGED